MTAKRTRCIRCADRYMASAPWDVLCGRCSRQDQRKVEIVDRARCQDVGKADADRAADSVAGASR
jgi:hypothetical protein